MYVIDNHTHSGVMFKSLFNGAVGSRTGENDAIIEAESHCDLISIAYGIPSLKIHNTKKDILQELSVKGFEPEIVNINGKEDEDWIILRENPADERYKNCIKWGDPYNLYCRRYKEYEHSMEFDSIRIRNVGYKGWGIRPIIIFIKNGNVVGSTLDFT